MSRMEVNKGVLTQADMTEERASELIGELPSCYDSFLECIEDDPGEYGYAVFNDVFYKVVFEVESGEEISEFSEVKVNGDGSIDFHTYHYNGGGHWTELLEGRI